MKFNGLYVLLCLGCCLGCIHDQVQVTGREPSAELISTQLRPKKAGTIRLENNTKSARAAATKIMKKVCAPLFPILVQVDKVTTVTGAEAVSSPERTVMRNRTFTSPVVKFECTEKAPLSPDSPDSELE